MLQPEDLAGYGGHPSDDTISGSAKSTKHPNGSGLNQWKPFKNGGLLYGAQIETVIGTYIITVGEDRPQRYKASFIGIAGAYISLGKSMDKDDVYENCNEHYNNRMKKYWPFKSSLPELK